MSRLFSQVLLTLLLLVGVLPVHAAFKVDSPTVMITGSNRGIGLAFAKHYAAQGWNVIATARSPARADDLKALQKDYPQLVIEQLDVTQVSQIDALAEAYRGKPIDVLINNAAVLGELPAQKVGGLTLEEFQKVMTVNVFGPLKVSEAFAEHVAMSSQKKIVALTSGLGSLRLMGRMSGFYYYRMSKAALNMGMLGLRTDLKGQGIIVGIVAPGMVNTKLLADSGYDGKSLEPDDSAAGMAEIIAGLTAEDRGKPINVDGNVIPW